MGLIIDDIKLKESVEQFFEKLNKYFPEHKVFALDSIDKNLRERLSELYKKTGYETAEKFLAEYGYEIISGEEVKKIRSFVIYTPGNEPEIIKNKVANILSRLNEYYPDRIISRGLQNDHKNLSKSVSGLYQWLGYQNASEMLKAYGFETVYGDGTGGRPENNYQELIDFLKDKYSANSKFKSLGELMFDNPEIKGNLKTLQNKAPELFGMSLSKYFKELGILSSPEPKEPKKVERKKLYHYLVVSVDGLDDNIICATDTRTISEGSFVEVCKLHSSEKYIGSVIEAHYFNEEQNLPMPINEMYQYIRKVTKTEIRDIEASKIKYIFCRVRIEGRSDTLYYISPFEAVDVGDIVEVPHNWYGTALGVITKIEHVSEKTAPYSVEKTKRIEKIVRRKNEELNEINNSINALCHRFGTEEFVNIATDKNIIELYESITHFSSAVFRGIDIDVRNALISLYPNELNPLKHGMKLENGFSQFECTSTDVPRIIKEFPNLKALFFAEYWKTGNVYLAYSESGYDSVTGMRLIGQCNFCCRDRWTLIHDPSEGSFKEESINYNFDEKDKWETCDYVLPEGNIKLAKKITIPSIPYAKEKTTAPCDYIEIQYLDERNFTEIPEAEKTEKVKTVADWRKIFDYCINVAGEIIIEDYKGDAIDVIIPERIGGDVVREIAQEAFAPVRYLSQRRQTNSIVKSELRSVVFPETITKIKSHAFNGCKNLTSIIIPNSVIEIASGAFCECKSLTTVILPDGIENIEHNLFTSCEGLTSITLPTGIAKIKSHAFDGCKNLTSIIIPDGVTEFGKAAFEQCESLSSISIPDSVKTMRNCVFKSCSMLADADGFIIIKNVLYDYIGKEKKITIPNRVKVIDERAFEGCTCSCIIIPDSVKTIRADAFEKCNFLTSLTIFGSATKIGKGAFYACPKLTIHAPAGSAAETYAKENNIPFVAE